MSPSDFVAKWKSVTQTERAVAQSHFNDLCELLGEPKPLDDDPKGERYAFEKGASKAGGGDGWADVWRQNCFAWEYKGKHKDLEKALAQVKQYATALQNPPLLVACDIERIIVLTNWTNTVSVRHEIKIDELIDPAKRDFLKKVFRGDERLRTGESRAALTAKVAREFATLAQELQTQNFEPLRVAHFVNRMVFCMFAEDAGLLGEELFTKMLDVAKKKPHEFVPLVKQLFHAMSKGGRVGYDDVEWFNGGLFDDDDALPLNADQIRRVRDAAGLDWSAIDPSILGTLFERGLDPAKRSQLGAHYTDPENIMRIVNPVVLEPLAREWEEAKVQIEGYKVQAKKKKVLDDYLERLRTVTVLDPACGSGNFLYLALRGLKDLELRVLFEAESLGLERQFPQLDPSVLRGIELNVYAAELARVSIWIGELQWQIEHGFNVERNPILKPLDSIENKDALMKEDGTEAEWPKAEFIIGNPPFIGDKRMKHELGDDYVNQVRNVFKGRVPGGADLVAYWFEKARTSGAVRFGLVSTQMIRRGRNNEVIRKLRSDGFTLYNVWQNEPWHDKGAMVRTSVSCFAAPGENEPNRHIDGKSANNINADFTGGLDISIAKQIPKNQGLSINGVSKAGKFNIPETEALKWLMIPNPSGVPNSDVLRPTYGADDLNGSWSGEWIIDFGCSSSESDAAIYADPFQWIEEHVRPMRLSNRELVRREKWWQLGRPRPEMRRMLSDKSRFLATGESVVKRAFRWLTSEILPDHKLVVFGTEDDYFAGMLEGRFHRLWAAVQSSQQGVVNNDVYPATRTFGTFPFPEATENQRSSIAEAARELDTLRENWLNPPEWTQEETLIFPATVGGPWHRWIPNAETLEPGTVADAHYVRIVPRPGAVKMVEARTLTRLYNEQPAWLRNAHRKLDIVVAEAYGLDPDISESDLLAELLRMNLEQSANQS